MGGRRDEPLAPPPPQQEPTTTADLSRGTSVPDSIAFVHSHWTDWPARGPSNNTNAHIMSAQVYTAHKCTRMYTDDAEVRIASTGTPLTCPPLPGRLLSADPYCFTSLIRWFPYTLMYTCVQMFPDAVGHEIHHLIHEMEMHSAWPMLICASLH